MHAPSQTLTRLGRVPLLALLCVCGFTLTGLVPSVALAQPALVEEAEEDEEAEEEAEAEEEEAPEVAPEPEAAPRPGTTLSVFPRSESAAGALGPQAPAQPAAPVKDAPEGERVYADAWWSHARPVLELHGYYRLRAELFHNFSLGRIDSPNFAMWPMPIDNRYTTADNAYGPALCTAEEADTSGASTDATYGCKNKTQAGANMRFRLNPELHISDNLRIMSQVDLLDNLVLGSTPIGYSVANGGVRQRSGYSPLGAFDTAQEPPSAGINSLNDSIRVKRVWGEYLTPVGQLRFGRMPSHWGLGILAHGGDGYDDDYHSTSDRILFVTGIRSLDLYLGGAWDFNNEGATSASLGNPQGQPYDLAQLDDVDQYVLLLMRRTNPELQRLRLAQGKLVVNGGAYVVHRRQLLANDLSTPSGVGENGLDMSADERANSAFVRREAIAWIPDLWLQVLYKKFRFEAELVTIQGSIESNQAGDGGEPQDISQWGLATELEQRLIEDRLRLQFKFGWASGDPDVKGISPIANGLQPQFGDDTISTFRFHPNYKVDMILNRNILNRVQGSYYFRPGVDYDFLRKATGQKLGGGAAVIWTRASEFIQTPGHARDLGVEINAKLYFQSKDGSLNDDPEKMGGFYTSLEWGVLFPLAGLGYQELEAENLKSTMRDSGAAETSTAQIVRWYMGILF